MAQRDALEHDDEDGADSEGECNKLHKVNDPCLGASSCQCIVECKPSVLDEHVAEEVGRQDRDKKLSLVSSGISMVEKVFQSCTFCNFSRLPNSSGDIEAPRP